MKTMNHEELYVAQYVLIEAQMCPQNGLLRNLCQLFRRGLVS